MGTRLPSPKRGQSPQFSVHVYCGPMAGWIKMPLSKEVGCSPSDIVRCGAPNFQPMSIATKRLDGSRWHLVRRQASAQQRCVKWGPSSPLKGARPPVFGPCVSWPNGWMDEDGTWYGSRPQPMPQCFMGTKVPPTKGAQQPPFRQHVYCGHGCPS